MLLLFILIALVTGRLVGMVTLALLTHKRNTDLESAVGWLYRASGQFQSVPAIRSARDRVWDVLWGG